MTPRFHNVLSYTGALLTLPVVVILRSPPTGLHAVPVAIWLPVGLWCAHFLRRALESAALHRYSKPTFPVRDAVVEYVYYWGFGAWIGGSLSTEVGNVSGVALCAGGVLFGLAELGNHACHRMLAALRDDGSQDKRIPHGFLFEEVSCPHYLFEILSWVGFFVVTQSLASFCFLLLASAILFGWAWQRHAEYKKRFKGEYPSRRRALLPRVF